MPIFLAAPVDRLGSETRTGSAAVRFSAENTAFWSASAVAGRSSSSPGADGRIAMPPAAVTWKRASWGGRETAFESRSRYRSAARPAMATSFRPSCGRRRSGAIRQRGTRQRVCP
jgi:hypothetical protein